MTAQSSHRAYYLIFFGFLIRLLYVQFIHPIDFSIYSDMKNYVYVADLIKNNDWRVTHFFQPIGFPYIILLLKSSTSNWADLLGYLHAFASTLTLWFLWRTSTESFGEKTGLWSLALATVHIPWIIFTGFALAENFFILTLSILAWLSLKLVQKFNLKYAILWGTTFFIAFLLKGTHVFLAPLFLIFLFLWKKKKSLDIAVPICVIIFSGLFLHGLFSYSKIGKFQMSASAGGLNFVEGKCPLKNNADSAGYSWLSPLYYQLGMTKQKKWDHPFTDSGFFMKEGLKCIIKNPYVLIQSLEGIPFLFVGNTLWPANQFKVSGLIRLYELFFAIFCIVGLSLYLRFFKFHPLNYQETLIWLLPILSVFICVYIFKSEIRFRIPFDLWFIPVSIKGWNNLFRVSLDSPQQL